MRGFQQKGKMDFSQFFSGISGPKLVGIGVVALLAIFLVHIGVAAYQAHKRYLAEKNLLTHNTVEPVRATFTRKLPPIDISADNLYQGLAKLSEFASIQVHFMNPHIDPTKRMLARDAQSFTEWATPLGLVKNVYTGKVSIRVNGPISEAGIMLPQIHNLFLKNYGILESVEFFKKTSGKAGAAGVPQLILFGTFYGSAPTAVTKALRRGQALPPAKTPRAPGVFSLDKGFTHRMN